MATTASQQREKETCRAVQFNDDNVRPFDGRIEFAGPFRG